MNEKSVALLEKDTQRVRLPYQLKKKLLYLECIEKYSVNHLGFQL